MCRSGSCFLVTWDSDKSHVFKSRTWSKWFVSPTISCSLNQRPVTVFEYQFRKEKKK